MAVECKFDASDGVIRAFNADSPNEAIRWSPGMWEEAVWRRIVDGELPALAREDEYGLIHWDGRGFQEGYFQVRSDDWTEFTDKVKSGEYSVETLTTEEVE